MKGRGGGSLHADADFIQGIGSGCASDKKIADHFISHGHGERQDLVLRRTCLVRGIGNGWLRRAVPVPNQSPRPGPARFFETGH